MNDLSKPPKSIEIQHAVVTILSVIKSMANGIGINVEFRGYVRTKYPGVDEDTITMIEDILEHSPGKRD